MKDRERLLLLFRSGVEAVAPDGALLSHVEIDGNRIIAGGRSFKIPERGLYAIGAGKGVAPMARAFENLLGNKIRKGFIVVKYGHDLPLDHFETMQAAHPVPDEAGERAARRCLEIANECNSDDLLVCLLTGGASALLPAPASGLTLADLQRTTSLLLGCGASIQEINTIRRHLSEIGGGGIVKQAHGAAILTLIVSDVIGDSLSDIASGPTVRDETSFSDCLKILHKYDLAAKVPHDVIEYLTKNAEAPEIANEEQFAKVANLVIASNRQALEAVAENAENAGFRVIMEEEPMLGEARDLARNLIKKALEIQKQGGNEPVCLLAGGETTVTLTGDGLGGRNQEMALAAALELSGTEGIAALFGGTDGTDGPTEAAGGFAFSSSVRNMGGEAAARAMLDNNDSNKALKMAGDLLLTGPTLTNVMDLAIILIHPSKKENL